MITSGLFRSSRNDAVNISCSLFLSSFVIIFSLSKSSSATAAVMNGNRPVWGSALLCPSGWAYPDLGISDSTTTTATTPPGEMTSKKRRRTAAETASQQ